MTKVLGAHIRSEGIFKSFAGVEVLRGVDLTAAPHEFTLLNGPSGSGKTTLLNIASGLVLPDAGQFWVGDIDVTQLPDKQRARFRAGTGLVFQRSGLLGGLTGWQNIELGHVLTKRPVDPAWTNHLARRLGIHDVLNAKAALLSGGQAQRVALVRALAHRPGVVFADEPTASLDGHSKRLMHQLLQDCSREEGFTILMVSHDEVSPAYADHVHTLRDGVVPVPGEGEDQLKEGRTA